MDRNIILSIILSLTILMDSNFAVSEEVLGAGYITPADVSLSGPLSESVLNGDIETVKNLLSKGADPNIRFPITRIFGAKHISEERRIELAKSLLDAGASIEKAEEEHRTCPHGESSCRKGTSIACNAAIHGESKVLKFLLESGANPNAKRQFVKSWSPGTPLVCAVLTANGISIDVINILLDAGAEPYLKDESGHTFCHYIRDKDRHILRDLLDERKIDLNKLEKDCLKTAL